MEVGERYCLSRGLLSYFTFIFEGLKESGKYYIQYEDGCIGAFEESDRDRIVIANPHTPLEKALL
jgi:hypothetical protein